MVNRKVNRALEIEREIHEAALPSAMEYLRTQHYQHSVTAGNRHCWMPGCEVCEAERQAAADRDLAMSMGLDSPGEVGVETQINQCE